VPGGIAPRPARAEVHRPDELEAGREPHRSGRARDADLAVLEWLAERLEHGPLEFGQLVEEEDAAVREARLARPEPRAAADDRRGRRAVVRGPERRVADQRVLRVDQSRDRVDPRHLERVLLLERRQDAGQPTREHRLPGAGRPAEEEVVPPGRRDLERAPRPLLPADVRQVGRPPHGTAVSEHELGRLQRAAQVLRGVGEVVDADGLDPGERGLGTCLVRTDQALQTGAPRPLRHREHAADPAQPAVQRQFAARRMLVEPRSRDLSRCGEQRQGDRDVEGRSLLLQLRGREIDGDATVRPDQLGGLDAAPNPLLRLLARAIGEPDDRQRGQPSLEVRLDLDTAGLEPDEGERDGAREHAPTLIAKPERVRVESVSRLRTRVRRARPRRTHRRGAPCAGSRGGGVAPPAEARPARGCRGRGRAGR
jgi:hypothetical protein